MKFAKKFLKNLKIERNFKKNVPRAYNVSRCNLWLDDFFAKEKGGRTTIYTFEKCKEIAQDCKSRKEFEMKNRWAYDVARKNMWLEEFFGERLKKYKYWTYEKCYEKAKLCKK